MSSRIETILQMIVQVVVLALIILFILDENILWVLLFCGLFFVVTFRFK